MTAVRIGIGRRSGSPVPAARRDGRGARPHGRRARDHDRCALGADAAHAEYGPSAAAQLIVPVACAIPSPVPGGPSLSGALPITLRPGSLAHTLYGQTDIEEEYFCNYQLNPALQDELEAAGLAITGRGPGDEARVVELGARPFLLATLYLPQLRSRAGAPHPVIAAYVRAVRAFAVDRLRPSSWPSRGWG